MKIGVVALLSLMMAGCCSQNTDFCEFQNKPPKHLRFATYSMNLKSHGRIDDILCDQTHLLTTINSDVLFIQEASSHSINYLNHALHQKYPYHQFKDFCHQGGMAIYSKYPFQTLHFILPEYGQFPAWTVAIKTPYGIVQSANVHLQPKVSHPVFAKMVGTPTVGSSKIRAAEIDRVLHHLEPGYQKIIIAGNFNESDDGTSVRHLRSLGFCDALNKQRSRQCTWRGRTDPLTFATRFDRVFSWGNIKPTMVQVLHEGHSNHYPVVVDFVL